MKKTTKLTQQDLQIYPSQRLTDTPDGGGLMVGTPLTGVDNELFPPTSDVDRTMGSFDARLVYPAVLRTDAEPLYGAHFIIAEPPQASNVSFLAFRAKNYGEERQDIMPRIEAYSVPTIESRMTLLGNHMAGIKIVQAYQRMEAPLPKVGERYCLKSKAATQYFRILRVSGEKRIFEVERAGQVVEIERRVVKMEISSPLVEDFEGMEYPVEGHADAKTKILETHIADSANYYGVRPIQNLIRKGDATLSVDSLFEKLVPTSVIETAYGDTTPAVKHAFIPLARRQLIYEPWSYGKDTKFVFYHKAIPGTIETNDVKDDGNGRIKDGRRVGNIDYAAGVLSTTQTMGWSDIYGEPAAYVPLAAYSSHIEVKDSNQGTEWAPLLKPVPAAGSVHVSFMSYGKWYELSDNGDSILRDAEGAARGSVSDSGTVLISLPAVPDVGSRIVITWAPLDMFKTFNGKRPGSLITPKQVDEVKQIPPKVRPFIKPGSIRLTWTDSGSKTATDNQAGLITGDIKGQVDYKSGKVVIKNISASAAQFHCEYYTNSPAVLAEKVISGSTLHQSIGYCAPGSVVLKIEAQIKVLGGDYHAWHMKNNHEFKRRYKDSQWARELTYNQTVEAIFKGAADLYLEDDGNGGWLFDGKKVAGATINYETGEINITAASLKLDVAGTGMEHSISVDGHAVYDFVTDKKIEQYTIDFKKMMVSGISSRASESEDIELNNDDLGWSINVLDGVEGDWEIVQDTWRFKSGIEYKSDHEIIIENKGKLYIQKSEILSEVLGSILPNGDVIIDPKYDVYNFKIVHGLLKRRLDQVIRQFSGRTPSAPVKPESFTAYIGDKSATSDDSGNLNGDFTGFIDYKTGFYHIESETPFNPHEFRFNLVTQDEVPLDSSIIGIDAVRLPPDGKVPIFRRGDMVIIGNRLKQDLGSSFQANKKIMLNRQKLDRLCLMDANNKHVLADKYEANLVEGSITFNSPLDLSDYAKPLVAVLAWEEENRVLDTDINGHVKLQFPVKRDYPKENTYLSSAVVGGDLMARSSQPFSQKAWDSVWREERNGDAILAKLNVKDYPIELTNDGAITERWMLKFTSRSQFELYGESLGLVAEADIASDLKPLNPATGKPYFTLKGAAFGGGWSSGNCIRFNTYGTQLPVWILRSIQPSPNRQETRDGFSACLRGNTILDDQE